MGPHLWPWAAFLEPQGTFSCRSFLMRHFLNGGGRLYLWVARSVENLSLSFVGDLDVCSCVVTPWPVDIHQAKAPRILP